MINSLSDSNLSFKAKMRGKDIRAMKNFYARELKETADPDRMDRITAGCQNFSKFLDKISEGDNNFTLKHTLNYGEDILELKHSKDKKFSSIIRNRPFWDEDPINFYNNLFSKKTANDLLEMEKILSKNYEKKQKSSSFLSKLFNKF